MVLVADKPHPANLNRIEVAEGFEIAPFQSVILVVIHLPSRPFRCFFSFTPSSLNDAVVYKIHHSRPCLSGTKEECEDFVK